MENSLSREANSCLGSQEIPTKPFLRESAVDPYRKPDESNQNLPVLFIYYIFTFIELGMGFTYSRITVGRCKSQTRIGMKTFRLKSQ
jgi:hypothetical protein